MKAVSARSLRLLWAGGILLLLIPYPALLNHSSQSALFLGRYSRGYFLMLMGYTGVLFAILVGGILSFPLGSSMAIGLTKAVQWIRLRRWLLVGLLAALPVAWIAAIEQLQEYAPGRSALFQLSTFLLVLFFSSILLLVGRSTGDLADAGGRILMLLLGVGLALGGAEVALRSFPTLIPDAARPHLPGEGLFLRSDLLFDKPVRIGYRYQPLLNYQTEYKLSNGDLYRRQAGDIAPLPPEQDAVQAVVHFVTDEIGYPNQPPILDRYDVVVTGDSFGVPGPVAAPWPRLLHENSGLSVLNLSMPGYSPRPEFEAVKLFGLDKQPTWIVVGYFEGNDLIIEPPGFEERRVSGLSWPEYDQRSAGPYGSSVAMQTLSHGMASALTGMLHSAASQFGLIDSGDSEHRYPVQFTAEGKTIPIAFYDPYVQALTASDTDIEISRNRELVSEVFSELSQSANSTQATVLIVYLPSKPHVYLPLVEDMHSWDHILQGISEVRLQPNGFLSSVGSPPATRTSVMANLHNQRESISELARSMGFEFLDLTPELEALASRGVELFYQADTHWTQETHRRVAQIIAGYLHGRQAD